MRKSPIRPKFDELGDYGAVKFDFEANFFQFLNEAKQHNKKTKLVSAPENPDSAKNLTSTKDKKCKKSWKATLFSWMGCGKKSKPQVDPENVAHMTNQRKGHVSGPVHGSRSTCRLSSKPRRLASGPLPGLFTPTKCRNELRYLSLEELENPDRSKSYGPVYLVT